MASNNNCYPSNTVFTCLLSPKIDTQKNNRHFNEQKSHKNNLNSFFPPTQHLLRTNEIITLCRFRVFCHWLVNDSTFGNIILVCIMCSSALLAVEKPIEPPGQVNILDFNRFLLSIRLTVNTHQTLSFHRSFLDNQNIGLYFCCDFYTWITSETDNLWLYST